MSPFIMCDLTKTKYQLLLHNSITIWLLITNSHSIPLSQLFLIIPAYGVVGKRLLLKVLIPASDVVGKNITPKSPNSSIWRGSTGRGGSGGGEVFEASTTRATYPTMGKAHSFPPTVNMMTCKQKHWKSEQTTNTKYEEKNKIMNDATYPTMCRDKVPPIA